MTELPGRVVEPNGAAVRSLDVGTLSATDERLMRELYAEHAGVLLGYVRRLVGGDTVRAEDVVQETLLRAWQHPEALHRDRPGGASVRAWLLTVARHLVIDGDLAWSHARFTEFDPSGDRIPNAVEKVASVGITYNSDSGFFGGARLRYFGPAPLIEDDSVRSGSTTLVNLEGGYHFTRSLSLQMNVFNLFNRKDNDITYFYESQLRGEAVPVADIHFHPVEPRTIRAALSMRF